MNPAKFYRNANKLTKLQKKFKFLLLSLTPTIRRSWSSFKLMTLQIWQVPFGHLTCSSSFYPGCSQIIPLKNFSRVFQPLLSGIILTRISSVSSNPFDTTSACIVCFKTRDIRGPNGYSWPSFEDKTFKLTETRSPFFWVACVFLRGAAQSF